MAQTKEQITIRMSSNVLTALDARVAAINASPGSNASRNSVASAILEQALLGNGSTPAPAKPKPPGRVVSPKGAPPVPKHTKPLTEDAKRLQAVMGAMTHSQAAAQAGVSKSTVTHVMNGRKLDGDLLAWVQMYEHGQANAPQHDHQGGDS